MSNIPINYGNSVGSCNLEHNDKSEINLMASLAVLHKIGSHLHL